MNSKKALAILNMLIFVFIFTIMAGIILSLVSSHTRLMERHIRRLKSFYVAQAGSVAALDQLRRTGAAAASYAVDWAYDSGGSPISTKTATISVAVPQVNSTCDYSIVF